MCLGSAISAIMAFTIFRVGARQLAGTQYLVGRCHPIPIYSPSSFIEIRMTLVGGAVWLAASFQSNGKKKTLGTRNLPLMQSSSLIECQCTYVLDELRENVWRGQKTGFVKKKKKTFVYFINNSLWPIYSDLRNNWNVSLPVNFGPSVRKVFLRLQLPY